MPIHNFSFIIMVLQLRLFYYMLMILSLRVMMIVILALSLSNWAYCLRWNICGLFSTFLGLRFIARLKNFFSINLCLLMICWCVRPCLVASPVARLVIKCKCWFLFFSCSDYALYCSLTGALQYLTLTRPNISFAVNQVCQYMHSPSEEKFIALKHILWYIKGTLTYGISIFKGALYLVAFSDADWAGCHEDRRSTTGFCVFLGATPMSWCSKK